MNYLRLLQELSTLKSNEKKTAEQLHAIQEKKLRRLLAFAYEHSPYYHNAFEAAGLTAETVLTAPPIWVNIMWSIPPAVPGSRDISSMTRRPGIKCCWASSGGRCGG